MSSVNVLIKQYKEETDELTEEKKNQLIVEYAPLIRFVAQRIAARLPSNIELDDLISSGVIGLIDAIEKYNSDRDNKFKTYAEFRIRGAILDELRAQDWVPRSIRDKSKMLNRRILKMESDKGRTLSEEEIAEGLGLSISEYYKLVNEVRPVSVLSIDDTVAYSNMDKKTIMNLLESCKLTNPFNQLNLKSVKKVMTQVIEELPERQRLVLSLYYYEDLNLKDIGQILRVTESRISQLHAQAIQRLRVKLSKSLKEEFA